jgi:hypothetical protein
MTVYIVAIVQVVYAIEPDLGRDTVICPTWMDEDMFAEYTN